jgi:hypothetical protein
VAILDEVMPALCEQVEGRLLNAIGMVPPEEITQLGVRFLRAALTDPEIKCSERQASGQAGSLAGVPTSS